MRSLAGGAALLLLLPVPAVSGATGEPAKAPSAERLREELAYTVGVQAYIYGYPVVEMYRARFLHVYSPKNKERTPLNRFHHRRRLLDASFSGVVSPNNDTLYSSAWLDLSAGPVLLSVPDTKGRYYCFQMLDFYTNSFAHVGKRTTGTKAGTFAIVGPGWKGAPPPGARRVDAPTNAVWLLGRTLVDGKDDLPAVHALQDRYTLTPLGPQGNKTGSSAAPAYDPSEPLPFFEFLNAALHENPPPAREAALMRLFARVGVGPDRAFRVDKLDRATATGLRRAVETGRRILAVGLDGFGVSVNGWHYPPAEVGNFGDNHLLRGTVAMKLLAALPPEEAVYPTAETDGKGQQLNGKYRYVLRMEKGQLPPVEAFWSLTLYRLPERLFAANAMDRYAIGDRTKGLTYGADGSLEIYIQHGSPGKDREANWLAAPAGEFCLTLRAFLPRQGMRTGVWRAPPVQRVE